MRQGIFLIHGLGGTRHDMGNMSAVLERAGYAVHAITLPGHGTRPQDLIGIGAADWLGSVRATYRRLLQQHATLHIVGMCMGALLAAEVCKLERHACGKLVCLAAPVFIDGWRMPWYRWLRKPLYAVPALARRIRVMEEEPYGIKSSRVRAVVRARFKRGDAFHYPWVPLCSVREVDVLRAQVRQGLDRIACETLIVHAHEDELTSVRSATFLHRHIPRSTLELLRDSYHMVCIDNERYAVAARVLEFLRAEPRPGMKAAGPGFTPIRCFYSAPLNDLVQ
jgi:carboxylesterase